MSNSNSIQINSILIQIASIELKLMCCKQQKIPDTKVKFPSPLTFKPKHLNKHTLSTTMYKYLSILNAFGKIKAGTYQNLMDFCLSNSFRINVCLYGKRF